MKRFLKIAIVLVLIPLVLGANSINLLNLQVIEDALSVKHQIIIIPSYVAKITSTESNFLENNDVNLINKVSKKIKDPNSSNSLSFNLNLIAKGPLSAYSDLDKTRIKLLSKPLIFHKDDF